ncbi:phosphodiesterase [uncultured Catenibacterium sp.]|uniref:phosphodiesterase n=1 Tax=uncultured Catenibacterium sp. TaxID=286142 RepID=UPI0025F94D1E|nr:phosphodiesterase [uncultured Catenibacterium sp.]
MKLMIISDIHGSYNDLEKVMHYFDEEQPDRLIILGDILYHGPRNDLPEGYAPKKCIPLLNQYKDKILAVRGNCDAEVDQMVLDFPMRGDYALLNVDGHDFYITHGHLYNKDNMPYLKKGDVFLYGHYHVPVFEDHGFYTVNPNSISLPKQGVKSFLVYENETFTLYNLEHEEIWSKKITK